MPLPLPDPQLPGNPQDALQSIQRNFEALALAQGGPSYQTTLPATPFEGQEIYYAANAADSIIWHLRYRGAARSGSGAWEFVGGPAITAGASGSRTRTANDTWAVITSGPELTIPRAGKYEVDYRLDAVENNGYAVVGFGNIGINNNDPTAYETDGSYTTFSVQYSQYTLGNFFVKDYSANDVLRVECRCEFGGAGFSAVFSNARIHVRPRFIY